MYWYTSEFERLETGDLGFEFDNGRIITSVSRGDQTFLS